MQTPHIIPAGKACGAEVQGVDLAALGPVTTAALQQAVHEHLAVVVRGQPISDPQLLALGQVFGALEVQGVSVLGQQYADAHPDHLVASNRMMLGRPTGSLGGGEAIWQTDLSYRMRPCSIAILHALDVPPVAGNTWFANQYLAYETLPADLKTRIDNKTLIHDESHDSTGQLRKGYAEVTDPREAPGAQHPIFRTHPQTGRKALYLGRRRNAYIVGLPLDDSEQLLDQLWAHATRPEFVWGHEWRVGDTLIWDNRCVIYRHDGFDAEGGHEMHRVQIRGEIPR
jgi:taurine dioxygenase